MDSRHRIQGDPKVIVYKVSNASSSGHLLGKYNFRYLPLSLSNLHKKIYLKLIYSIRHNCCFLYISNNIKSFLKDWIILNYILSAIIFLYQYYNNHLKSTIFSFEIKKSNEDEIVIFTLLLYVRHTYVKLLLIIRTVLLDIIKLFEIHYSVRTKIILVLIIK